MFCENILSCLMLAFISMIFEREASKEERGFNRSIPSQQDKSEFASKEMEEELRKTRDRLVMMTTDYNLLSGQLINTFFYEIKITVLI